MTECGKCGAAWTGHRIEHCTACHETFTGTTAGDRHRVGDHGVKEGPNRRRCLTTEEMRALTSKHGARLLVRNERGQWTTGGTNPWATDAPAAASAKAAWQARAQEESA